MGFQRGSYKTFSSVQSLSRVRVFATPWMEHARLNCPSPTPRLCSNSCPSSQWCHPTTSFSVVSFPPAFNLSQHQGLFQWISSSHQMAKLLELQLQHQSLQWIFSTDFLLTSNSWANSCRKLPLSTLGKQLVPLQWHPGAGSHRKVMATKQQAGLEAPGTWHLFGVH